MAPAPAPRRDSQLRVLDLSNPQRAARIELDVSPAYELLVILTALRNPDSWASYTYGATWFDELRSRMSPALRAAVGETDERASCAGGAWAHLIGLVHAAPGREDLDAAIDHIAAVPAHSLYRTLIEGTLGRTGSRDHADLVSAAVAGDQKAGTELLDAVCQDDHWEREALESLMCSTAEPVHEGVVMVLRGMRTLLGDHLDRIVPALRHDAEERRERIRGLPLDEAVEVGTDGIHYTPETGVRRILLIPQAAMRPWVLMADHADAKLFMVAVGEDSLARDHDTPPARLLSLTKALAEEQRLRILRRLAGGPASLQQIADHLGIAKSTAHHHLVLLRAAGLTIVDMSAEREYTLREGFVADVAALLDTYLRGGAR